MNDKVLTLIELLIRELKESQQKAFAYSSGSSWPRAEFKQTKEQDLTNT